MSLIALLGAGAMIVGLGMVVAGTVLAWRAETAQLRADGQLRGGPTQFVGQLTALIDSLSEHPVGIRLVALGIVCFVLGGATASVSAFAA